MNVNDPNYQKRKRIQRIKNTVMLAISGGYAGGMIGTVGSAIHRGGAPSVSSILLGAGIGSLAGGALGHYGTNLHQDYYESAGLDPTVPSFKTIRS